MSLIVIPSIAMSFTIAGKPPAGLQRIERNGNEVLGKEIRIIRIIFSACNKKKGRRASRRAFPP